MKYSTNINGVGVYVDSRDNEVQRIVTVTDSLTGQEFIGKYPKSFTTEEIAEMLVEQATKDGKM